MLAATATPAAKACSPARRRASSGIGRQRGLSLVEMMVGVAVGLLVVAGATLMVSTQLMENRRLLVETQLQQDLRAAMDIITRELRRSGSQQQRALESLWIPGSAGAEFNTTAAALSVGSGIVEFSYQPPGPVAAQALGFKLDNNIIKTKLGTGGWQELTDAGVMRVTRFSVTPTHSAEIKVPCLRPCTGGGSTCWPSVQVRELAVEIEASARNMPEVTRSLRSNVRLRNDYVRFFDPVTSRICP